MRNSFIRSFDLTVSYVIIRSLRFEDSPPCLRQGRLKAAATQARTVTGARELSNLRAVGKKHGEGVVGTSQDELLSGGMAVIVEEEQSKFIMQGKVVRRLRDR